MLDSEGMKIHGSSVKGLEWIGDGFAADIGCYFCLGQFYVKFAPAWPSVRECLVALSYSRPSSVIPNMLEHMQQVNRGAHGYTKVANHNRKPFHDDTPSDSRSALLVFSDLLEEAYETHLHYCVGDDAFAEADGTPANQHDADLRDALQGQSTDNLSVLGQLWSILERLLKVLESNSNVLTTMFFSFMTNEHFVQHRAVETTETQSLVQNMQLVLKTKGSCSEGDEIRRGKKENTKASLTKSGSFVVASEFLGSVFTGAAVASSSEERHLSAKVVSRNLLGFLKILSQVYFDPKTRRCVCVCVCVVCCMYQTHLRINRYRVHMKVSCVSTM
jgi:hypothetical protein